ncbi:transcription antiterminator [Bulleidia sp. zg-1006]|uniref:BglG family transcription antiterminator n=1 Tax=Bulleidia sp. zg-1006 TaxID=2806552 RepID=UPI001939F407|nr:PTS sugar transporter subunit IIA [Bulleidia sp. zg-1006]QRG86878.1 PTS sugar transporter subunit IIA [Bulleidia sp. zg-1006]
MFNDKETNILKMFLNGEYIHIQKIADDLSISNRTVSRAISDIKDKLKDYHMTLQLHKHLGYKLSFDNHNHLLNLQKELDISSKNTIELQIIAEILQNSPTSITDLAEKLYYSESVISSKLKNVESLLNKYHLTYFSKPNYGIEIKGSEAHIRNLIIQEYMIFNNNRIVDTILPIFNKENFKLLEKIIKNKLYDYHFILSDMDYSNLLVVIIAASFRNSHTKAASTFQGNEDDSFIQEIVNEINESFQLNMDDKEIHYISTNTILNKETASDVTSNKIKDFIHMAMAVIHQENPDYYQFNDNFYNLLFIHMDLLIKRTNTPNVFINPLLSNIKKEYLVEFNDAIKLGNLIKEYFDLEISDDEIGYLAIHLASSARRINKKKTAIILCNYGVGTSLIVKQKIEKTYDDIEIIGVYPSTFLNIAINSSPDFIITTTKLDYYPSNIPLIDAGDVLLKDNYELDFTTDNNLNFFFSPNLFFNIQGRNKDEILTIIEKKLIDTLAIEQDLMEAIMEREQLSTTEIGHLFAMPHAIKSGDFKSFIAVFRNDKKIIWSTEEVQLIFILLLNRKDLNKIEILKKLYKKIGEYKIVDQLLSSYSYLEFIHILNEGDES